MKKWIKIAFLCIVIFINIFLAYQPHFSNPYPILGDEYTHVSFGKYISQEHQLPYTNPYIKNHPKITNLESGFHYMLAFFFLIIPGEPVLYYKYFIILFMIINSLLLFYLIKLWFKDYYVALLTVLFYGTIKSTGDLLAHNYFIPLTLGVTLLFLSLILFYKWENANSWKNKYLMYLAIISLITIISYPPTLTFLVIILIPYIFFSDKVNEKFKLNKKKFNIYFVISLVALIIIGLILIWYFKLWGYLIFPESWTPINSKYSPILFFGIIPFIFSVLGALYLVKERLGKLILSWVIISIIQIWIFYVFKFTILVPFQRLFVFYLIGISILAGLGINYLVSNSENIKEIVKIKQIKNIKIILIILIIILLSFNYYLLISNPLKPVKILLDDNKYQSLMFIKDSYNKNTIIISDNLNSIVIYPVTGDPVLGIINHNIGGGFPDFAARFSYADCKKKSDAIKAFYPGYTKFFYNNETQDIVVPFLSETKINCSALKPVYERGPYIYELITNFTN